MTGSYLRKAEVYVKNKGVIYPFGMLIIMLAVLGCGGDDCPTCPSDGDNTGHYSGLAYLSMQFGFEGFYIYDTDSGAVIDSVLQPGYSSSTAVLDVSPDGRYIVATFADFPGPFETRIYDAITLQIVQTFPFTSRFKFIDSGQKLITQQPSKGGTFTIYSVPSFGILSEVDLFDDLVRWSVVQEHRAVYALMDNNAVFRIDYDSMKLVDHWTPHDDFGRPIFIQHFDVSPDGETLFINGLAGTPHFYLYDLVSDAVKTSHRMFAYFGELKVTPNGKEVWVTDPGSTEAFTRPEVGMVFIFDARSGAYMGGISLYGFIEGDPLRSLDAKRVDFSPDGREAYITTGAIGSRENPGTFLRIDTNTREIIDVIFPRVDRFPNRVVLAPRY